MFRIAPGSSLLILLYHGVRPKNDATSPDIRKKHVPEDVFRQQLALLKRSFTPIALSEAVEALRLNRPLPPRPLCITFDDGYANNAETAAPILKEFGMPATFFVTTDFLDQKTRLWVDRFEIAWNGLSGATYDVFLNGKERAYPLSTSEERAVSDHALRKELKKCPDEERERILLDLETKTNATGWPALYRPMTWEQARRLITGGFEIGAHTLSHPILSRCSDERVKHEIEGSKRRIEEMCRIRCKHFAHPNGQPDDWNDRVMQTIRDASFESCSTTVDGFVKPGDDPFFLKRITVDTGENMHKFRLTISGFRFMLSSIRKHLPV